MVTDLLPKSSRQHHYLKRLTAGQCCFTVAERAILYLLLNHPVESNLSIALTLCRNAVDRVSYALM